MSKYPTIEALQGQRLNTFPFGPPPPGWPHITDGWVIDSSTGAYFPPDKWEQLQAERRAFNRNQELQQAGNLRSVIKDLERELRERTAELKGLVAAVAKVDIDDAVAMREAFAEITILANARNQLRFALFSQRENLDDLETRTAPA